MNTTVEGFLANLPEDRQATVQALRAVVQANLPPGYVESFASGMIAWSVPMAVYPDTYNKQPLMYVALANQKNYVALYLCHAYSDPAVDAAFRARWHEAGKKLDMGKSCVRIKRLQDVAMDAVAEAVAATPMEAYVAREKAFRAKEKAPPR